MQIILNIPQQDYPLFMDWLVQFPNYPQIKIEKVVETEEVITKKVVIASITRALQDVRKHEKGLKKLKPIAELFHEL